MTTGPISVKEKRATPLTLLMRTEVNYRVGVMTVGYSAVNKRLGSSVGNEQSTASHDGLFASVHADGARFLHKSGWSADHFGAVFSLGVHSKPMHSTVQCRK